VPKREYALKDINLTLGQNDDGVILLVGRSASGKSTILRLIAGMEMPTQGCVSINGRTTAQLLGGEAKGVSSGMPSWIKVGKITECVQPVILDGKPDFDDSLPVLFSIACGCMKSVAPAIKGHNDDGSGIPYPILLLDEMFDTEVPSTVEKCNKGITNLIECGAIVISATHRPNYFKGMSSRVVTLSGGKVLTDVVTF